MLVRRIIVAVVLLSTGVLTAPAQQVKPLRQVIDEHIAARWKEKGVTPADLCSDAEFLRRITLDLTGTLPAAGEVRAFLADPAPAKRQGLVDRLLASAEHARHLALVLDVMLQERQDARYVTVEEWQEYLRSSVAANKPWDHLVREILGSDGKDPKSRPAIRFYLARNTASAQTLLPDKIVRDLGRLFLGVNLQCAQCHDHPHIPDYKQADYHGLKAFVNRMVIAGGDANAKTEKTLNEVKEGVTKFTSVFDKKSGEKKTGPKLPGHKELPDSTLERRATLARLLPAADNPLFTRNSVNRLWDLMMGRGLVQPLDLHHAGNPPSHPELLNVLAERFTADKFNIRQFLRELALSRTYQLASIPARPGAKLDPYAAVRLRPLRPHVLARALMQATGLTDAERLALGNNATEEALYKKLAPHLAPFVPLYGKPAGQADTNFESSLFQALFLANADLVNGWLAPRPGNLLDRAGKLIDPAAQAEELYLSIYTRAPDAEESAAAIAHLKDRTDRAVALQELAWAMLAAAEFRFQH